MEALLRDRRRWGTTTQECEGKAFLPHTCRGGLQLNEVIFPRGVFQRLAERLHKYFWHVINCSVNCKWFHETHGHSNKFRRWFLGRVSRIYGGTVVANYIGNAPLKIKSGRGGLRVI